MTTSQPSKESARPRPRRRPTEEARKKVILDCAAALFGERGYSGTTTQDIADAAQITKRTLYRYMPSKEDILFEIHSRFIDDRVLTDSELSGDEVERIDALLRSHIRVAIQHREEIRVFFDEMKHLSAGKRHEISQKRDAYEQRFVSALREGAAAGRLRVHNAPLTARLLLGGLTEVYRWYRPGGELSEDEVIDGLSRLALRGIAPRGYLLDLGAYPVPRVRTPEDILGQPLAQIYATATELLASQGYQRTTTQELAEVAGVTKGALFYRLGHKEAALDLVHSTAADEAVRLVTSLPQDGMPAADVVALLARTHCAWLAVYRRASAVASEETKYLAPEHFQAMRRRQDEYSQPFREALIRGQHRDEFSFGDIRLATAWLLGVLNSIYRWYQPGPGRLDPDQIGVAVADLVLEGIERHD
jgi:AcrR family transcriptional regulator